MYAEHNPTLKAGVAWYGRLVGEPAPEHAALPVEGAVQLRGPRPRLLRRKGQRHSCWNSIEKMRAELKKGKGVRKSSSMPRRGPRFHADYRPSITKRRRKEGWEKVLSGSGHTA